MDVTSRHWGRSHIWYLVACAMMSTPPVLQSLAHDLLWSGCCNQVGRLGSLQTTEMSFSQFWWLGDQGAGLTGSGASSDFSLFHQMEEEAKHLSQVSLTRTLILFTTKSPLSVMISPFYSKISRVIEFISHTYCYLTSIIPWCLSFIFHCNILLRIYLLLFSFFFRFNQILWLLFFLFPFIIFPIITIIIEI